MVWFLFWPKNVMTIWWLGNLRYRGKEYMLVVVVHYKYECYEWWNSGNSWITFELVHYRRNLILFSFAQPWSNSSVMNVEILDMFLPSIRDLCQPLARSFLLVCLQEHLCGTWICIILIAVQDLATRWPHLHYLEICGVPCIKFKWRQNSFVKIISWWSVNIATVTNLSPVASRKCANNSDGGSSDRPRLLELPVHPPQQCLRKNNLDKEAKNILKKRAYVWNDQSFFSDNAMYSRQMKAETTLLSSMNPSIFTEG